MNNILDIIYNLSRKQELINDKQLQSIMEIIKLYNNLYNLDFNINKSNTNISSTSILGTYSNNEINIYLNRLYQYIYYYYNESNFKIENNLNMFQRYFKNNLYIIKVLFHNIEHYYQDIIYKNNKNNSLENKLIILEKQLITDNKTNNNSFLERNADIKSYKKILNIIKSIKSELEDVYILQEQILLDREFIGYSESNCPTFNYFEELNKINDLANIINEYSPNDLSFEYRLSLGLPIEDYEYDTVKTYLKNKKRD